MKNNFFIKLIKSIFFYEIIEVRNKISLINYFIKNISIPTFFLFIFNRNKYNPIKQSKFKEFISENKKKWKNHDKKISNNNFILVESFVNHPAYTLSNIVIGFFLSKKFNYKIMGLIRNHDIKSEVILRSYGCKKIIFFKNPNLLERLYYLIKTILIIGNENKTEKASKIKINGVDIGLIAYDTFIRYKYKPTLNIINSHYLIYFAQALYAQNFIKKHISKNKIKISVLAETQYVPLSVFFQTFLKKNINIFTRSGLESFTVRMYKNWKQRYHYRETVSQKLFNWLNKNHKTKSIQKVKKIYNNKFKKNTFGVDEVILGLRSKNYKKLNYNSNKKKKNVVLFLSHLLDGNFVYGPRKYSKDVYSGSKFIIDQLPKLKNVNWLIKKHPNHNFLKSSYDFNDQIKEYEKKYDHIKLLNDDVSPTSLLNLADIGVTLSGSVGVEYPAFGIPCVFIEKTYYSNLKFFNKINSKKDIQKTLQNIHKLKIPTKKYIENCLLYLFVKDILLRNRCYLIPKHIPSRSLNEELFWRKAKKNLIKFSFSKDEFYQMLEIQLNLNLRHTINFNVVGKTNTKFNDFD